MSARRGGRSAVLALGGTCSVLGAVCWVLGAGCLVLDAARWVLPAAVSAQERIANGRLETRSAAQGLERAVSAVGAASTTGWVGYRLPAAPGSRHVCSTGSRIMLESPAEFFVLARLEAGRIGRLRVATPECEIDAGGTMVTWMSDVKPAESAAWLSKLVTTTPETRDGLRRVIRPALAALAMHADAGVPALAEIARTSPNRDVRRQAVSWLGQSTDPRAVTFFEEILTAK